MKTMQKLFGISIFILALSAGCGKSAKNPQIPGSDAFIPVKTMVLQRMDINGKIHASGQFTTNDETLLSFKTGGIINRIYVKEGDKVKKGQILASLDLTEISAQVSQARIALDKAIRDHSRAQHLYSDSVATLEQLQNAQTGLELAQQQMVAAQFNLKHAEIKAPGNGVILNKFANEGQIIGVGTPILQTSSKGQTDWILCVAVSDREWAKISLHDRALVDIDALNGKEIEGYVFTKAEQADPQTGSYSIDIKLRDTRNLHVASGMFGKATIISSETDQLWRIPYDALLDGNANSGFVFVTNNGKEALKVPVKIEEIDKNNVLISEGLAGYQTLIVEGSAYLKDNSPIRVVSDYAAQQYSER
jgi:RND family efflux transporter MFP subunit